MIKWEYLIIECYHTQIVHDLDHFGSKGWELASTFPNPDRPWYINCILKRPLKEKP